MRSAARLAPGLAKKLEDDARDALIPEHAERIIEAFDAARRGRAHRAPVVLLCDRADPAGRAVIERSGRALEAVALIVAEADAARALCVEHDHPGLALAITTTDAETINVVVFAHGGINLGVIEARARELVPRLRPARAAMN